MASIIDSFKETLSDNFIWIKMIVFAAPVFATYMVYLQSTNDFTLFWWLAIFSLFLLFGILIKTTNGVLNESDSILPTFNLLKIFLSALKGVIATAPYIAISVWLAIFISSKINIMPVVDIISRIIIWLIASAIMLTSFLLFVKEEKISDAFNLKLLFEKSGDLIVAIIFLILQMVVINLPTTGFITYTLVVLFGVGPLLYYFLAMALIFNIGVLGHYFAQLQYEIFGFDKSKII